MSQKEQVKVVDSASAAMYARQLRMDIEVIETKKEGVRKKYAIKGLDIFLCFFGLGFLIIGYKFYKKDQALKSLNQKILQIEKELSEYDSHRL